MDDAAAKKFGLQPDRSLALLKKEQCILLIYFIDRSVLQGSRLQPGQACQVDAALQAVSRPGDTIAAHRLRPTENAIERSNFSLCCLAFHEGCGLALQVSRSGGKTSPEACYAHGRIPRFTLRYSVQQSAAVLREECWLAIFFKSYGYPRRRLCLSWYRWK